MNNNAMLTERHQSETREAIAMLTMIRLLGSTEQQIAYAVLEGMKLQKAISQQSEAQTKA